MAQSKQRVWAWVIPVLLLAFALAVRLLDADILFVDEYWSIRNSGGDPFGPLDFGGIWQRTATVDPGGMGVMYHWLLAGWQVLLGASPYSIRAFSLLVGMLSIAWVYRLGADLFTRRIGLYAAIFMGASAFYVDYLHEGRAYTLFALLTITTFWLYWRIHTMSRDPSPLWYVAFISSLMMLVYTHYVALSVGAVLGLFHLAQCRQQWIQQRRINGRWLKLLAAMAIAGALYLPWVNITLQVIQTGTQDANRQSTAMVAPQVVESLLHTFSNGNIALLLLLMALAVWWRNRAALLVWLWLGVCFALILVVNARIPFMVHARYLILLWGALAIVAALGVAYLMRRDKWAGSLLLVVWIMLGVYQAFNPAFINDLFGQIYRAPASGFDEARRLMDARGLPGDLALFHIMPPGKEPFNYFVLGYYMDRTPFPYDQLERMNNSFAGSDNEYINDALAKINDAPFIWTMVIPDVPTTQRSNVAHYLLRELYAPCAVVLERPDMVMTLHARQQDITPDVQFAEGQIGAVMLKPVQLHDGFAHVTLGWRVADGFNNGQYSVGLHVYDAAGQFVGQVDYGLPGGDFACRTASLDVQHLAAGDYDLRMVIYNWQSGERLTNSQGADTASWVTMTLP